MIRTKRMTALLLCAAMLMTACGKAPDASGTKDTSGETQVPTTETEGTPQATDATGTTTAVTPADHSTEGLTETGFSIL